jgi:hypothetical protein
MLIVCHTHNTYFKRNLRFQFRQMTSRHHSLQLLRNVYMHYTSVFYFINIQVVYNKV